MTTRPEETTYCSRPSNILNHSYEESIFHQVLMPSIERLMTWFPSHQTSFLMHSNNNTCISAGQAVDEVNNHQLKVCITIHLYSMLSVSEIRKSHVLTLGARVQRHISISTNAFLCNCGTSLYSLPPIQVWTQHSWTPCMCM